MKRNSTPFKWRHFEPTLILLCDRWYYRYQLSYRDLEEMMRERGLSVDHATISDCVKTQFWGEDASSGSVRCSAQCEPHGITDAAALTYCFHHRSHP